MSEYAEFQRVNNWIFDLDNTLYPRDTGLFAQIDKQITSFVSDLLNLESEPARKLQKSYYHKYGTTLRGLMMEHDVDVDAFLEFAHDIDHKAVDPNPALSKAIQSLPGKKYIYTNGSRKHAEAVAARLGIDHHFEDIFDIVSADLVPKPVEAPYQQFFKAFDINPKQSAMFEDLVKNLKVPKKLGMVTALIVPEGIEAVFHKEWELENNEASPVDFVTEDLATFLTSVNDSF